MWIVYDNEEGLLGIYDKYEEALSDYEKCKESQKDYVQGEGEFTTDERVILARVERQFYGYETNEKAVSYDENGDEYETEDNVWDWKEDISEQCAVRVKCALTRFQRVCKRKNNALHLNQRKEERNAIRSFTTFESYR